MDPTLADEVKAFAEREAGPATGGPPVGPAPSPRADRVRAARSRFLPYVVAGGAMACGYLTATIAPEEPARAVVGGVCAGTAAGLVLGWGLLGAVLRVVTGSAGAGRWLDLVIILLTVPAYLVAGLVSVGVGWVIVRAFSGAVTASMPPDPWGLLIAVAVVLYPLSYAFARRDRDRPADLVGALAVANAELHELPQTWSILRAFLVALGWFAGGMLACWAVAIGVQAAFPELRLEPALAAVVFLAAWGGITVGGTAWTLRRGRRGRSHARARPPTSAA